MHVRNVHTGLQIQWVFFVLEFKALLKPKQYLLVIQISGIKKQTKVILYVFYRNFIFLMKLLGKTKIALQLS